MDTLPPYLEPSSWLELARRANAGDARSALATEDPGVRELAILLSSAADGFLEEMAGRAEAATRRHFGRTISLYVPLYLSNHCPGGCAYCGFASDRKQVRRRLEKGEIEDEIRALREAGFDEVLLLTGERTGEAGFEYLREGVEIAARHIHSVTVESFAMTTEEYGELVRAGCTGITLYQETYDPKLYDQLHRWGPKKDFLFRLEAPERAFAAGLRTMGMGVLLGLSDPQSDLLCLYLHARHLQKQFWQGGVQVSFPRICGQQGDFKPQHEVDDRFLARAIFAFRICLPDVPLVLSTRESPSFRDGMAGVGISRMSVASKTSVGGYSRKAVPTGGQFEVHDGRDVGEFCAALRKKGLDPVFKNWDSTFRSV